MRLLINRIGFIKKVIRNLIVLRKLGNDKYNASRFIHKKIRNILTYAKIHCAYYRNILQDINIETLENFNRIPLLDKNIIRKYKSRIVSDEINKLQYYTMNTGGSTGEPLEFPVSDQIDSIHQKFLYRLIGYKKGEIILAFDGSTVGEDLLKKHVYWVSNGPDLPYGRTSFSSLYLNSETIKYYINEILRLKPAILRGYPSFLNELSEYILTNSIDIDFTVKGVELTAEMAYENQITNIKNAFKTKIYFQYGHSEVSIFGYTCNETFEYYCSPLYGFTEVLNSDGNHVKIGEVGEVVVTGFYNKAMPFIRYRTGDMAIYNGEERGIVKLKNIKGRTQDYILLKNGEKMFLTALIFGQHFHAFNNIKKWQIVQNNLNDIKIKIIKEVNFSDSDSDEIKGKFKNLCDLDIQVEFVNDIPLSKRGKYQFLIQNIK